MTDASSKTKHVTYKTPGWWTHAGAHLGRCSASARVIRRLLLFLLLRGQPAAGRGRARHGAQAVLPASGVRAGQRASLRRVCAKPSGSLFRLQVCKLDDIETLLRRPAQPPAPALANRQLCRLCMACVRSTRWHGSQSMGSVRCRSTCLIRRDINATHASAACRDTNGEALMAVRIHFRRVAALMCM